MKHLLVALDSSPRSEHVLEAALELARSLGGSVTLMRSVGLSAELLHEDVADFRPDELIGKLVDAAKKSLADLEAKVPESLRRGIHVQVGTPWDAICSSAKELGCDLIVIGSHGYSGVDRVLGTTAARVVNHADRSVLVVR